MEPSIPSTKLGTYRVDSSTGCEESNLESFNHFEVEGRDGFRDGG